MTRAMDSGDLPEILGRHIVLDDRGIGLRATWRPAHGFVNVSLWRDDRCVETFHLTPKAASELVAFLVSGLAASVPSPTRPSLRVVPPARPRRLSPRSLRRVVTELKIGLAKDLDALAGWLRR